MHGRPVIKPKPGPAPTLDHPGVKDEVIRLYRKGWSARKIAKLMDVAKSTVYWSLSRWGIARRPNTAQRLTCMECRKPTNGALRCTFHKRVWAAQRLREWRANRKEQLEIERAAETEWLLKHQLKYNRRLYKLGLQRKNQPRSEPNATTIRKIPLT